MAELRKSKRSPLRHTYPVLVIERECVLVLTVVVVWVTGWSWVAMAGVCV